MNSLLLATVRGMATFVEVGTRGTSTAPNGRQIFSASVKCKDAGVLLLQTQSHLNLLSAGVIRYS